MPAAKPASAPGGIALFRSPYAPPDEAIAAALLAGAARPDEAEARIDARATRLVQAIRAHVGGLGGVEDFLHAYALSTKEGLALMVLAEALLRVPDADTADRLIEDKLKSGDWSHHDRSTAFLVSASAWTLGITARVIQPGETPEGIVETLIKRLGLPAVRAATRQAMKLLGSHFVLGQTIEEALERARSHGEFLYSFDMLGEGARTAADAARYFNSYANAIEAIGKTAGNAALPRRPGISVKLSALNPRFEPLARERVLKILPQIREQRSRLLNARIAGIFRLKVWSYGLRRGQRPPLFERQRNAQSKNDQDQKIKKKLFHRTFRRLANPGEEQLSHRNYLEPPHLKLGIRLK